MSAQRGKFERFDYVLFDEAMASSFGIKAVSVLGDSPNAQINSFHRDLTEISAQRLVEFAEVLLQQQQFGNVGERDIITSIIEGLKKGHIKKTRVREWKKFEERVNKLGLDLPD
jgi:hypothetical protein